jgi:hypothetical protein
MNGRVTLQFLFFICFNSNLTLRKIAHKFSVSIERF